MLAPAAAAQPLARAVGFDDAAIAQFNRCSPPPRARAGHGGVVGRDSFVPLQLTLDVRKMRLRLVLRVRDDPNVRLAAAER